MALSVAGSHKPLPPSAEPLKPILVNNNTGGDVTVHVEDGPPGADGQGIPPPGGATVPPADGKAPPPPPAPVNLVSEKLVVS